MTCFLDMDGVIVDLIGPLCSFHGIINPYDYVCNHGNWHIGQIVPEFVRGRSFWESLTAEFWAGLPFMPDGEEIVAILEKKFRRGNICLLTAPTGYRGCSEGKELWIQRNLPRYRTQYLIGTGKHFCAGRDKLLVDDKDENIDDFVRAGGHGVLVRRIWNSGFATGGGTVTRLMEGLCNLRI